MPFLSTALTVLLSAQSVSFSTYPGKPDGHYVSCHKESHVITCDSINDAMWNEVFQSLA